VCPVFSRFSWFSACLAWILPGNFQSQGHIWQVPSLILKKNRNRNKNKTEKEKEQQSPGSDRSNGE